MTVSRRTSLLPVALWVPRPSWTAQLRRSPTQLRHPRRLRPACGPRPGSRDAAVNAWNAASLLGSLVGANTLWAVVDEGAAGLIVQQDNQWWDQIVWVIAAWHHFTVTGDRAFLADAYETSASTLAARRAHNLNADFGLFAGPSFMNDGIAGYPSPPYQDGIGSSFVLDYPHADELMCLSTNCLYLGAYDALAEMALRMICFGLFGLTFTPDALTFAPTLPAGWGRVTLSGLPYRDATLDIELSGAGNRVRSCTIDGRPSRPVIAADRPGEHTVRITLTH
jgi:hypothetical protein